MLLAVLACATATPAFAEERRIALVIDNSAYADSPAANPVNDARLMGGALRAQGFDVIERLDACRNNPYERGFRDASRGLALMEAPTGTLIAYSTAPGQVAIDGSGANSPYTEALARAPAMPGVPIEQIVQERAQRRSRGHSAPPNTLGGVVADRRYKPTSPPPRRSRWRG